MGLRALGRPSILHRPLPRGLEITLWKAPKRWGLQRGSTCPSLLELPRARWPAHHFMQNGHVPTSCVLLCQGSGWRAHVRTGNEAGWTSTGVSRDGPGARLPGSHAVLGPWAGNSPNGTETPSNSWADKAQCQLLGRPRCMSLLLCSCDR